jgi:hypothetical protein
MVSRARSASKAEDEFGGSKMPRLRFALAVAFAGLAASPLHAQCLAPGQPIEMVQPAPVVVAAPSPTIISPPAKVQTEELLPPPMRIAESPPEAPPAQPAPTYVEAAPAAPAVGSGPTPLNKVNILQNWILGEDERPNISPASWDRERWERPLPPGCHWTRDLEVVGPIREDQPADSSPTSGREMTSHVEIPAMPKFDAVAFPLTFVGELKPLNAENVFRLEVGGDPLARPQVRFRGIEFEGSFRGFEDGFGSGLKRFADPWECVPDAADCCLGVRCLALGFDVKSLRGIAYRWVPSDWQWECCNRPAVLLFRQTEGDTDLYFVVTVADLGSPAKAHAANSTPVCLQFDPTDNRWQLVDTGERRQPLESPLGLKESKESFAERSVVRGHSFDHWLIRYRMEGPSTGTPSDPPRASSEQLRWELEPEIDFEF